MDDVAIKIDNVSKQFLLPHEKRNSIKSIFTTLFNRKSSYTKQKALKGISFDIKKGEFFGIVGRNGSGKSTLLKIIAGIYQPTDGKIHAVGKLVPFIELGVGFNPELTGRENVYLNGAILGFTREEIAKNYNKIVAFSELEEFMDQKLKNYSSGMQVRLAFACATMAQADILLVDEVLAVGDADFQRKCFKYFKHLKKKGTTVVYVTHDMSSVREYCTRGVLLDSGTIKTIGTPEKIAEDYTKLFNIDSVKTDEYLDYENRWGDGNMSVKLVSARPSVLTGQDELNIDVRVACNKEIDNPIFGIKIRDMNGQPIMGTNTKIVKTKTGKFTKGKIINISWLVPNIFSDGEYFIDPAIVHDDGVTVCDWWDGAKSFTVKNDRTTHYPVSPNIKVRIT